MEKTALVTGVTGQDGSYLSELLLHNGYHVVGICRRQSSASSLWRIEHLLGHANFQLEQADLCDQSSLDRVVEAAHPDEVYNLAAQSFVATSWQQPVLTGDIDALGVTRMLEATRRYAPDAHFVQAASSEMFGSSPPPQYEATPFRPRSPYGVSKVYAYFAARNYRESYGMRASNAISFNHGSPRRGVEFVEQKVSVGVGRIQVALERGHKPEPIQLGDLWPERDWLHSRDVVRAQWLMAQQDGSDDYVVASGRSHSIQRLCEVAFGSVDLDWQEWVRHTSELRRPAEVNALRGNSDKLRGALGWEPEVSFEEMVTEMVAAAVQEARSR